LYRTSHEGGFVSFKSFLHYLMAYAGLYAFLPSHELRYVYTYIRVL